MLAIDDATEFADLLDRLNVSNGAEAALVEADVQVESDVAAEGIRFWTRHYK